MNPLRPTGIGANAAKNVFKVVFSEPLSSAPQLTACDDYFINMVTILHKIFTGTEINGNLPMIGGIGLTTQPPANWWPSSKVAGAAVDNASRLMGGEGFCLLAADAPEAEEELFFNLNYKFPADALPADTFGHVVAIVFQYTGAPPSIAMYTNEGTEGSPSWVFLTPGLKGSAPLPGTTEIKPCDIGRGDDGMKDYFFTFPETGEKHPDEIWVKDYEA